MFDVQDNYRLTNMSPNHSSVSKQPRKWTQLQSYCYVLVFEQWNRLELCDNTLEGIHVSAQAFNCEMLDTDKLFTDA